MKLPKLPEGMFFVIGPREAVEHGYDYSWTTFGVAVYKTVIKKRWWNKTQTYTQDVKVSSRGATPDDVSVKEAAANLAYEQWELIRRAEFIARESGTYGK